MAVKISEGFRQHAEQSFLQGQDSASFWASCERPLRTSVRVNTLKSSIPRFKQTAADYGWQISAIPWCEDGFWVDEDNATIPYTISHTAEHILGEFYIQEASSMLPATALAINPIEAHHWVMDMAAAPGSKTTQLAAMMNNQGVLLANELSSSRLKSLHANLLRCGVLNCALSHWDAANLGKFVEGCFDYVLLDAPCGGEGTVRKDPEALANWQLEKVRTISAIQKQLIISGYRALRPGGRLVYSTCTLSFEENQEVISHLLENSDAAITRLDQLFDNAGMAATEEGYLHILPHLFDSEGFFVAAIEKPRNSINGLDREQKLTQVSLLEKSISRPKTTKKNRHQSLTKSAGYSQNRAQNKTQNKISSPQQLSAKEEKLLAETLTTRFGYTECIAQNQLYKKHNTVWLLDSEASKLQSLIKLNRAGQTLGEFKGNKFRLSHEFVVTHGQHFACNKITIQRELLAQYLNGQNLELEQDNYVNCDDGEVLVSWQGIVVGLGVLKGSTLKNNLARHLIIDKVHFR